MIPIQVPLLNGQARIEWTSGQNIDKEYYEDLSSVDQYLLEEIYNVENPNISWEDYIIRYDNKIDLKHWKIFFFLGGNNENI